MEEDNIIKKKKKKNYYRYHNNQNRNYYYKNKKKKKNLILENNSDEVENILLYNEPQKHDTEKMDELSKKVLVVEDNKDIEPVLKEKKGTKLLRNHFFKFGLSFVVLILAVFGVSFSYFYYKREDPRQADIASGDVYVKLVENPKTITLNKMYPRTNEEARSKNDNYFDFTIKGKNTSETKAVLYTISINNGANVSGKTRINPKYINVDLQEKINGDYVYVKEGVNLVNYNYVGMIPINTANEITKEYRLRIWVNDSIIISDSEANASYTQAAFANLYANFDISVNAEDKVVAYSLLSKNADTETQINFANVSSSNNGEGLYRLSGTQNNTFPIYYYRGAVSNNNVIFGDFCWQMVRTTDTGGIKMIYNGEVTGTNETPTCENINHADRIISQSVFNSQAQSMSDVGYMSNTRYVYQSASPTSGAYFGTSIEYGDFDSDGTNEYRLVDDGNGGVSTTLNSTHHYTCNLTTITGTCETMRYYYYYSGSTYRYINLTGGEKVEDALYKMTGSGTAETKARNANYVLNKNDSMIKTTIENWFKTNLTNEVDSAKRDFSSYLEDTVYCNDRSYKTTGSDNKYEQSGWNPNGGSLSTHLYFGAWNKFNNSYYSTSNVPSITCPNETDRFSVSSSIAHLKYPVGLLTVDEVVMAGASGNGFTNNHTYYLYTGDYYWLSSPSQSYGNVASVFYEGHDGYLAYVDVNVSLSFRPVVSLKLGTEFVIGGNGTPTNPYVVKYN